MFLHLFTLVLARGAQVNTLMVDAREATRGMYHVSESLAVQPGSLMLAAPILIARSLT